LGHEHEKYTGYVYIFDEYEVRVVASSNGHSERRYAVKLLITVAGRKIRAHFTLTDRSTQVYPVLLGRNVLRGKFVVDVKLGEPLIEAERAKTQVLRSKLINREG